MGRREQGLSDAQAKSEDLGEVSVVTDLDTIAVKLEHIRDVARREEELFENLRVTGRFEPKGESFTLVIQDGKCRHDRTS